MQKPWKKQTEVIHILTETVGTTPKKIPKGYLGIGTRIFVLQKIVIIYSARILRKVLEIWAVLLTPSFKNVIPIDKHSVRHHDDINDDDSNDTNCKDDSDNGDNGDNYYCNEDIMMI